MRPTLTRLARRRSLQTFRVGGASQAGHPTASQTFSISQTLSQQFAENESSQTFQNSQKKQNQKFQFQTFFETNVGPNVRLAAPDLPPESWPRLSKPSRLHKKDKPSQLGDPTSRPPVHASRVRDPSRRWWSEDSRAGAQDVHCLRDAKPRDGHESTNPPGQRVRGETKQRVLTT